MNQSSSRQRAEDRIRARVIRWALSERVYEALGGTPFEDVLEGLPKLDEIRAEIELEAPTTDWRELHVLIREKLALKQEVIDARNRRNTARYPIMQLARQVDRFILLEDAKGRPADVNTFIRARTPRTTLDRAASQLGLSRENMWERFTASVAQAKTGDLWLRYSEVLEEALSAIDWEQHETGEAERQSRFPNTQKRWSTAEDEELRSLFNRLWDEGLEPPIHGAEAENKLLASLSHTFGRTPGAIWQRLVGQKLMSAIPARNKAALASRRHGEPGVSFDQAPPALSTPGAGEASAQLVELTNTLRKQTVECRDYLIVTSEYSSNYYVQLPSPSQPDLELGELPNQLYAEAVANEFLDTHEALSLGQEDALRKLGWNEPKTLSATSAAGASSPNWWRIFPLRTDDQFAVIATALYTTLTSVYRHRGGKIGIELSD